MVEQGVIAPHEHWLLSGVPLELLKPTLEAGHDVRFLPGEIIIREGGQADGVCLILRGPGRVRATNDNGPPSPAWLSPYDVLAEMGVRDGKPPSAAASSLTLCVGYF